MIKYNTCVRCGSEKIDVLMVNSRLSLSYPEENRAGVISQKIVNPTDALVCKNCGHIELFIDWEKSTIS